MPMSVSWIDFWRFKPRPVTSAWDWRNRTGLGLLCIGLILFFGLRYDNFFTVSNGFATLLNISSIAIAAVGSGFLLVSGNVDLSIGGMYALISVVVAKVAVSTQSPLLAVLVGLLFGLLLGLINGGLVQRLKISPIIVTIATSAIFRGMAYWVTGGVSVFGFPAQFIALGRTYVGPAPLPVLIAAVIFIISGFVLVKTVVGLRTYAIGGNEAAARLNGIRTGRFTVGLYMFNGLLMGVVATLATARLGSGTPSIGINFELDVLTAVILGGVAFNGGGGHPLGIFIGVATIAVLNTGLIFAGLQDWFQDIARGGMLLLALGADQYAATRRARAMTIEPQVDRRQALLEAATAQAAVHAATTTEAEPAMAQTRQGEVVFRCADLAKSYGTVTAVHNVGFNVTAGEVVCLVGDNGAGKSTVIKMISGAIRPDRGSLELFGKPVQFDNPSDARAVGIETVYQDLALCTNLGAAHNMVLGKEPTSSPGGPFALRDDATSEQIALKHLLQLNIALEDYNRPVGSLSGGQRQCVAIARVVKDDVAMVILDEPTAALGVSQTKHVLTLIRTLAARNVALVLITHDIETVFAIADRIIVLRLGQVVYDGAIKGVSQADLVHLMAGIIPAPVVAASPVPVH
jgi:ribose/xylose/arabinose/galactoside ABC-type transport system permease subunit/ABC-type branched-subunit amino acid transport system ATPase component